MGSNPTPSAIRGEKHPNARINWEAVKFIRERFRPWHYSATRLAKETGVSVGHVRKIIHGLKWKGEPPMLKQYDFSSGIRGKYNKRRCGMIHWSKYKPSAKIIDLLELQIEKGKAPSLADALNAYAASDKIEYPKIVALSVVRILGILDGKRKIDTLTAKDAIAVFNDVEKDFNKTDAFRARAIVTNAIKFAITGEVAAPQNRPASGGETDVAQMKFQAIKTKDALPLVPMYSTAGRFGWVKAGVQKLVYTLGPDDSGFIAPQKRSMTPKEAKAIEATIAQMLKRSSLPWVMRWNPDENIFILIREADFETLFPKREKETKKGGK